mmetsp:Transcript_27854/g.55806  ORF Transcript_27854/g.55806 Transcript_27854/m.55806 type:complete len:87 (-) Transcript_27854:656-916(-)
MISGLQPLFLPTVYGRMATQSEILTGGALPSIMLGKMLLATNLLQGVATTMFPECPPLPIRSQYKTVPSDSLHSVCEDFAMDRDWR